MSFDLIAARDFAESLARQAGALLLDYLDRPKLDYSVKGTAYDIATEADSAAERLIVAALRDAYAAHHLIGEEGGGAGAAIESADYRWYIDPIDGTTNYANRIPHFAVSLALTDRAMRPLVGVVYNPVGDECFSAVRGAGAWLNGAPMRVSTADALASAVIATGFPYDRATNPANNIAAFLHFLPQVRDLRRFGSAALDLAFVAAGRFDGYWEMHLKPWDYLAGLLCVLEAGGLVTDYQGVPHTATEDADMPRARLGQIAAGGPAIHALLVAGLRQHAVV